jgi:hypothetical protein
MEQAGSDIHRFVVTFWVTESTIEWQGCLRRRQMVLTEKER